MIDKKNFEEDHISQLIAKYPKVDPAKMEMTIFAFGLLDELVRCKLPIIFKGGTSLLLLLDKPQRVSTDIDIIVPPNIDFDKIFEKVKNRFPFYEGEERGKTQNKYFRHFYFSFKGPISKKECRVNLDVAFENNPYPKLIEKELNLPLLKTVGTKTFVSIPSEESILGDKLTAFAPSTIGVNPFATSLGKTIDNRLQVMKQFYDIARLFDVISSIEDVLTSYKKCSEFENKFRETNYTIKETLLDTFNHCAEIASMGLWNKDSTFYKDVVRPGTLGLASNIFDGKYNQLSATKDAAKIMYLCACLLTNHDLRDTTDNKYKNNLLQVFKSITDKGSFDLIRKSLQLLIENKLL